MIRVVVTCGEEDDLVRLPLSTPVLQVKKRWAEKHSLDIQDLLLSSENGSDLHDDVRISDITENPAKVLQLTIEQAVKVDFSVIGGDKAPVSLSVFPSVPLSSNIPKIKEHLSIEEARPVRFMFNGDQLDVSRSFEEQQVLGGNSKVELEQGWRVFLKSEWTRVEDLEPICCFSGDLVRPTLTSSFEGDFELFYDGKRLDFDDSIGSAFGTTSLESKINHSIELRIPCTVFVMEGNNVQEMSVFDNTTIKELSLNCYRAVICNAEDMSADRKIVDGAGNVLLLADLCVVVVLSHENPQKRRRCIVRLSGRATVNDLWSKVMKMEESRMVGLFFRGRRLDDSFAELRDCGIKSGSSVVSQKEPPLKIHMRTSCGNSATFSPPETQSVTYSDLMRFHKAQDGRKDLSWAFLKGLGFRCNGCGRLISRELDGRQLVPAACCDVASLDLTTVHHSAEKSAQTFPTRRSCSVALDNQFDLANVTDAASQTECLVEDASIQVAFQESDAVSQPEYLAEEVSSKVELHRRDFGTMAREITKIGFMMWKPNGECLFNAIDSSSLDSLSDLLEKLSAETNFSIEDFSFIFQCEVGIVTDGKLQYFALNAERNTTEDEEKNEWNFVYANRDDYHSADDSAALLVSITNIHITTLDDFYGSPGLVPVISIDLRCMFCELDSSEAFNLIPRGIEALSDSQYICWIECIRVTDTRNRVPSKLLLEMDTRCVDVNSGEFFDNRTQAMAASNIPPLDLRDELFYILLRHDSRLPKWPIDPDTTQGIAVRDGCDFSIEGGKLKVKQVTPLALSRRWIGPKWNAGVNILQDSKPHMLVKQVLQFISS